MSGKYDVVDGGIVESHAAGAPGPNDRQRNRDSSLAGLRLQNGSRRPQNEGPRRTALAPSPRLQAAVHAVGNIDRRAHGSDCAIFMAPVTFTAQDDTAT